MSTATITRKLLAVVPELAKLKRLPAISSIGCYGDEVLVHVAGPYQGLSTLANLAAWAEKFDAPITVSLSWIGGSGDVKTEFVLAKTKVVVKTTVSIAHAYQFGGVLGKPLSKDKPIVLTAAELLDGIAKIAPAATS